MVTRKCVSEISFYNQYVDKEKDILGKFSSSLFTLNTFYTANKRILRRNKCDDSFKQFLVRYWSAVQKNMVPWNEMVEKEISKKDLRELYIASQAVVIQAFGKLGAYYFDHPERNIEEDMLAIKSVNWRRGADIWKLRVIRNNGRMINNDQAITLALNVLKNQIGAELSDDEKAVEERFISENVIKIGE